MWPPDQEAVARFWGQQLYRQPPAEAAEFLTVQEQQFTWQPSAEVYFRMHS